MVAPWFRDAKAALGALAGEALPVGAKRRAGTGGHRRGKTQRGRRRGLSHRARRGHGPGHLGKKNPSTPRPATAQVRDNRRFDGYKDPPVPRPDSSHRRGGRHRGQRVDRRGGRDLLEGLAEDEYKPRSRRLGLTARRTPSGAGEAGCEVVAKVPPVRNATGLFTKGRSGRFENTEAVNCPAASAWHQPHRDGGGWPRSRPLARLPLRNGVYEVKLGTHMPSGARGASSRSARSAQATPEWQGALSGGAPTGRTQELRTSPPTWGGRNDRVRGRRRFSTDADTRDGALNLARLAVLGSGGPNDVIDGASMRR